jgi:glycosyltransferase involved in cell wall biosynthesis
VLEQGTEVEIVVVDDGSTSPVQPSSLPDGTKVIRHETALGPAIARNAGVWAAQAEWVAFLDDDDIWLPGKVEAVLKVAEAEPEANVIFHATASTSRPPRGKWAEVPSPLKRMLHQQPPHLSGVAVKRDVHQRVRFDETMWATEDLDYLIRLAQEPSWVESDDILSLHGTRYVGTAIDLESRIRSRLSLIERHGDLITGDPKAHSFFYVRLGHLYIRASRYDEARRSFTTALRLRPTSSIAWKGLARSARWTHRRN